MKKKGKKGKKGQIQLTFNWIYIAVAGVVILLFFLGIVVRQAKVSEERLSIEVTRIMESILTSAGISEKTKNFIDASGLADYTLFFECEDGVSEFGILGKPAKAENSIDPLFAPKEINSHRIITWSLPYKMPFKVIDMLMVTSGRTRFFVVGQGAFAEEFINSTEGFNRVHVSSLETAEAEGNIVIKVIDVDGTHVPSEGMPESFMNYADEDVSAVVFTGANQADFYQKEGNRWKKLNLNPVRIISLGGERDAARYAAIFAADDDMYKCNMMKAYRRLEILAEVYGGSDIGQWNAGGKISEMIDYYGAIPASAGECPGYLETYEENALGALTLLKNKAAACQLDEESCLELIDAAEKLRSANDKLRLNCITLY